MFKSMIYSLIVVVLLFAYMSTYADAAGPVLGTLTTTNSSGRTGSYYLPSGYDQGVKPLLVLYHGTGGSGSDMVNSFRDLAESHGFIIVAPDSRRSPGGEYTWEVGTSPGEVTEDYTHTQNCIAEVDAIANVGFDPSYKMAAGFSGGGSSAPYFATREAGFTHFAILHGGVFVGGLGSNKIRGWLSTGDSDTTRTPDMMRSYYYVLVAAGFTDLMLNFYSGGHSLLSDEISALIDWWLDKGFVTWILVQNPSDTAANIKLTFMTPDGATEYTDPSPLNANTRRTYKVNDHVSGKDVSTKVESTNGVGIISERAMYWYDPTDQYWEEGHDAVGVTSTSTIWYLAEGCTNGFDTWILVQNPSGSSANIKLTFMTPEGAIQYADPTPISVSTRRTYKVNNYVSGNDVSTKVESTNGVGIIAERAMYWYDSTGQYLKGGHDAAGVTSASTVWYLAEGCTRGFDTWILVQNPSGSSANIKLTFMTPEGATQYADPTPLAANTRRTYKVNNYVPGKDVSTKVESTNGIGIIAERAMYWYDSSGQNWQGGHDAAGVTSTSTVWYLAEGCTRGFDTWILVQNPSGSSANIKLTFMTPIGATQYTDPIPLSANTRRTYKVNDYVSNNDVSTKVESTNGIGIIAERAMYWYDSSGQNWQGGHDAAGVTSTSTVWYLAEGCTR